MQKGYYVFALALLGAANSGAQPATQGQLPPVRIILVGDSTVALHNGWGPGFCAIVTPEVKCLDVAKNGRSSGSYRAEGSWATVMDELKHNAEYSATYVLIQFGHNDQPGKPGRSTDLATEFPANMRQYVKDVTAVRIESVRTVVNGNAGWDWTNFYATVRPEKAKDYPPPLVRVLFLWSKEKGRWICKGDVFVNGGFKEPL